MRGGEVLDDALRLQLLPQHVHQQALRKRCVCIVESRRVSGEKHRRSKTGHPIETTPTTTHVLAAQTQTHLLDVHVALSLHPVPDLRDGEPLALARGQVLLHLVVWVVLLGFGGRSWVVRKERGVDGRADDGW